jgi:hypothetical protein
MMKKESNSRTMDVSNIQGGYYILRIDSANANPVYQKVIIE